MSSATYAEYVLPLADQQATLENVGGKGASLARLINAGLSVPAGFHVTTAAYRRFVAENELQPGIMAALEGMDLTQPATLETASGEIRALFEDAQTPLEIAGEIAMAYAELKGRDPVVAVRSSATAEDLPEASFAGQQETYLNISGITDVLEAVKHCWASLWTARAIGYRARQGIDQGGVSLAVVVQDLVPAEAAGILFTANPITGRRDQAMISAAWGLGEAVVGGLVTPDTINVDKASGAVLEHLVADKQVMTARISGGTEEQPVPEALRRAPVLEDHDATELVRVGVQIEELFRMPMDIEWALADGKFAIVQARPITALPEPKVEPPSEWPMPDPKGPYMRGSIADFMPDPLTPLFKTLGVPIINAAFQRSVSEAFGGNPTFLDDYLTTINDYAYLFLKLDGKAWWWILTRMAPGIPRILRSSEQQWREAAHPDYVKAVESWRDVQPSTMRSGELLNRVEELTAAMADYLTRLQLFTLGTAAGSEGLFSGIYDKLVKREGDPRAATMLLGGDNKAIQSEKALYDLAQWCREDEDLAEFLLGTPTEQLKAQLAGESPAPESEAWLEWRERFWEYLAVYGHCIYDLDFAKPLPLEMPGPQLEALKLFVRGGGVNPHERQRKLIEQREEIVGTTLSRIKGLRLRLFRWAMHLAQTFTVIREDSIFDIGLSYPIVRQMLRELGQRFVEAGVTSEADDIYWLERAEVVDGLATLARGEKGENLGAQIEKRKTTWRAEKRAIPPQQLPPKVRVMGIKTDAFMAVSAEEQGEEVLKGVAASPGKVKATARILLGPEDFSQMQPGEILVADITTPAWTPLFALAAGLVTNIGGPLSHGSIVAREYGIPAVLGTGVATQRIRSGQFITVDGSEGLVHLV